MGGSFNELYSNSSLSRNIVASGWTISACTKMCSLGSDLIVSQQVIDLLCISIFFLGKDKLSQTSAIFTYNVDLYMLQIKIQIILCADFIFEVRNTFLVLFSHTSWPVQVCVCMCCARNAEVEGQMFIP